MNQSPLHDLHLRLGAGMVEFAGWNMPIKYAGILEEHHHTRTGCSVFDVSHMGRIKLTGKDVEAFLQRLCTRNLADAAVGQSMYSHMCKETGGILDDVIVSHYEGHWGVVCNASNREKILAWLTGHVQGREVKIEDQTLATAMVAIQGPITMDYARQLLPIDLSGLKRYRFTTGVHSGVGYTIARSGYTGEDGVEVIVGAGVVKMLVSKLLEFQVNGQKMIKPAGLGARDTLRLEAAMPLYGHELTEDVDSLTAGQAWCVDLAKDFIGADSMRRLKAEGFQKRLVGLELEGKRIARQGFGVTKQGSRIGEVTSGTLSPTLGKSIAMAFVDVAYAEPGSALSVDLSGKPTDAVVVALPFYKRSK